MSELEFKGAIFDCDGVLLDSMGIWKDLGVRGVKSYGLEPEPDLSKKIFAMSMEQGVAYILEHYPIPRTPEQFMKELQQSIHDFYFYEVKAKPGTLELLEALRSKGIPMIVLTSSPKSHVEAALEREGLLEFFLKVMTTSEIGESKHSRVVFDETAKTLGLNNEDVVVIEDSLYALTTASNASFKTIGVFDADGEKDQQGLEKLSDLYVKNMGDIISHI